MLVLSLGIAAPAPKMGDEPVLLQADTLTYDRDGDVIIARGRVEIQDSSRTLLADEVTYDKTLSLATARGNVRLITIDNQVVFAEYMEITDDLKEGFVQRVRMLLSDDSRLAAIQGYRRPQGDGVRTYLTKGVYSPCHLCKANPRKAPLWQIKAKEVLHDDLSKDIIYKHAFMEIYGVPVLYTPYLSHPDPTVKKRSGFLSPVYGSVNTLGTVVGVPYYWVIRDDMDMTLMPVYTSDEGWIGSGQYRQHLGMGIWELNGSYTKSARISQKNGIQKEVPDASRGHIKTKFHGQFKRGIFAKNGEAGFDIFRASDPTYVRRYARAANIGYYDENTLTSRVYWQEYGPKSDFVTEALYFQGQRANDNQATIPLVAPNVDYLYLTDPGRYGQYMSFQANGLVLRRHKGTNVRRTSFEGTGIVPYISPLGEEYRLSGALRTDMYNVDSHRLVVGGKPRAETVGRFWPRVSLDWKYPFVRLWETMSLVLEPVANMTATSSGSNKKTIPNEDSEFEFDDSNVMLSNRFSGRDRVDSGKRASAGLNAELHAPKGRRASLFFAQTYTSSKNLDTFQESGTRRHLSDYVGRATLEPEEYLKLIYRFRLRERTLGHVRSLGTLYVGKPILSTSFSYLFSDKDQGFNNQKIHQGAVTLASTFHKNWAASVSGTRNLGHKGHSLSQGARLSYFDECFRFDFDFKRTFYKDRDIKAGSTYLVTFTFKNLGSISTDAMNSLMNDSLENQPKKDDTKKPGQLF